MSEFTCNYPSFRAYGKAPYEIVVVHGGPGAPGEMEPVARKLSEMKGILEPLQKQTSIEGQILELQEVISTNCESPIILTEKGNFLISESSGSKFPIRNSLPIFFKRRRLNRIEWPLRKTS
jgi:hypothetical protein